MTFVGIDENGLGPILGPLVVTGVAVSGSAPPGFHPEIGDSKKVFRPGAADRFRRIESVAVATLSLLRGKIPSGPREFLRLVSGLSGCSAAQPFCWERLPQSCIWASDVEVEKTALSLGRWLDESRCRLDAVCCRVLCPDELNRLFAAGISKSEVDFRACAEIVRRTAAGDAEVEAGKIGGMRQYGRLLERWFAEALIETISEEPAVSRYRLVREDGCTELRFRRDVEDASSLASLASVVGKYVRELFMEAVNSALGTAERVSGYRDEKTAAAIRRLPKHLPISCLVRTR